MNWIRVFNFNFSENRIHKQTENAITARERLICNVSFKSTTCYFIWDWEAIQVKWITHLHLKNCLTVNIYFSYTNATSAPKSSNNILLTSFPPLLNQFYLFVFYNNRSWRKIDWILFGSWIRHDRENNLPLAWVSRTIEWVRSLIMSKCTGLEPWSW